MDHAFQPGILIRARLAKEQKMLDLLTMKNSTEYDLSGWDTSHITDMSNMFKNCTEITTIINMPYLANVTWEDLK